MSKKYPTSFHSQQEQLQMVKKRIIFYFKKDYFLYYNSILAICGLQK